MFLSTSIACFIVEKIWQQLILFLTLFQFNLAIKDYPDIDREANAAISNGLPGSNNSYVIEISLRTSDADALVLEVWSIAFINKCCKILFFIGNMFVAVFIPNNKLFFFLLSLVVIVESEMQSTSNQPKSKQKT